VRELQEQQGEADRRAHELAAKLRDDEVQPGERERARLREELRAVVEQQFEVRSELRAMELERLRGDVGRLQRRLEAVQAELDRRAAERTGIIERRMQELLERDGGD
jgi:hypothetical protein